MIIPNLKAKNNPRKIFGIGGQIASGKTTAAEILKDKGYEYTRYSQILKDILKEKGEIVNRDNLQALGLEMSKKQTEFSKKLFETIKDFNYVVIDGLRYPEDYTFFFEMYGFDFNFLFIEADDKLKEARYISLGNTKEDYLKAISNDSEINIPKLKLLSNNIIYNNESIEVLKDKVYEIIEEQK